MGYRDTVPLAERKEEAAKIRERFPDRIPAIVERAPKSDVPDLDKSKFLVPADLSLGQFSYVVRRRLVLPATQALFLFVGGSSTLPASTALMRELYAAHAEADGFLYVRYSGESTFGGAEADGGVELEGCEAPAAAVEGRSE